MIHVKILSELAQIDRGKFHLCLAHNRGREENRETESCYQQQEHEAGQQHIKGSPLHTLKLHISLPMDNELLYHLFLNEATALPQGGEPSPYGSATKMQEKQLLSLICKQWIPK
jgi:hypothetical protein